MQPARVEEEEEEDSTRSLEAEAYPPPREAEEDAIERVHLPKILESSVARRICEF